MAAEFVLNPEKSGPNKAISGRTRLSVLRLEHAEGASLPLMPLLIYKSIIQIAGNIEGCFPDNGGARYTLKVSNPDQLKALLKMNKLIDGTPVVVTEHEGNNVTRCVVKCREVMDLTEEEILETVAEQGVIGVRKITRKSDDGLREETPSIVLTFSGSTVPEYVTFSFFRVKTHPYYPQLTQCFKCWQFWHIKPNCSCEPICGTCSGPHDTLDSELCTTKPYCRKCKTDDHSISSRKCPKYVEETAIARIKIDRNISYEAAKKAYERENVLSVDVLLKEVSELKLAIESKDHEIQVLRGLFNSMQQARKLQSENQPTMPQQIQSVKKKVPQIATTKKSKPETKQKQAQPVKIVPQTATCNKPKPETKQKQAQPVKIVPQTATVNKSKPETKQKQVQPVKVVPQTVVVDKSKPGTKQEHSQTVAKDQQSGSAMEDSKTTRKSRSGKKKRGKGKK